MPIGTIFLGVAPFLLANLALIALLLLFPQLALWLPNKLF
jgi:TRAP-type mannitol/chloroaromatic compound transport system permease large subunit